MSKTGRHVAIMEHNSMVISLLEGLTSIVNAVEDEIRRLSNNVKVHHTHEHFLGAYETMSCRGSADETSLKTGKDQKMLVKLGTPASTFSVKRTRGFVHMTERAYFWAHRGADNSRSLSQTRDC